MLISQILRNVSNLFSTIISNEEDITILSVAMNNDF